jgi:anti-sigma B factor antagonist
VSTLPLLEDRLLAVAFDSEHRCVVLDGMELTFIDSSGMRLLLSALRAVGRRGGCLTVACANPTVLRLFAVTGMDQTLVIRPTPAEALEATRSSTA